VRASAAVLHECARSEGATEAHLRHAPQRRLSHTLLDWLRLWPSDALLGYARHGLLVGLLEPFTVVEGLAAQLSQQLSQQLPQQLPQHISEQSGTARPAGGPAGVPAGGGAERVRASSSLRDATGRLNAALSTQMRWRLSRWALLLETLPLALERSAELSAESSAELSADSSAECSDGMPTEAEAGAALTLRVLDTLCALALGGPMGDDALSDPRGQTISPPPPLPPPKGGSPSDVMDGPATRDARHLVVGALPGSGTPGNPAASARGARGTRSDDLEPSEIRILVGRELRSACETPQLIHALCVAQGRLPDAYQRFQERLRAAQHAARLDAPARALPPLLCAVCEGFELPLATRLARQALGDALEQTGRADASGTFGPAAMGGAKGALRALHRSAPWRLVRAQTRESTSREITSRETTSQTRDSAPAKRRRIDYEGGRDDDHEDAREDAREDVEEPVDPPLLHLSADAVQKARRLLPRVGATRLISLLCHEMLQAQLDVSQLQMAVALISLVTPPGKMRPDATSPPLLRCLARRLSQVVLPALTSFRQAEYAALATHLCFAELCEREAAREAAGAGRAALGVDLQTKWSRLLLGRVVGMLDALDESGGGGGRGRSSSCRPRSAPFASPSCCSAPRIARSSCARKADTGWRSLDACSRVASRHSPSLPSTLPTLTRCGPAARPLEAPGACRAAILDETEERAMCDASRFLPEHVWVHVQSSLRIALLMRRSLEFRLGGDSARRKREKEAS